MGPGAQLSSVDDARAFAESVAGVLVRGGWSAPGWAPGATGDARADDAIGPLRDLGWDAVATDPELLPCAGLGAIELGRRLAPMWCVDALLGGAPSTGDLVRSLSPGSPTVLAREDGELVTRAVLDAQPLASADGLAVHRILSLGDRRSVDVAGWPVALDAWLAAGVGYLAGVGQGALDLTMDYVRQRRAFGSTLAALAPVQQLLAGAATAVRGVTLLASDAPGADALAHASEAIVGACAACHQVSGAIGYTLEHPLHRYSQRARALATWNEALVLITTA